MGSVNGVILGIRARLILGLVFSVMAKITITLGPRIATELSLILSHEHIFVDLWTWDAPGYAQAKVGAVVQLVAPAIIKAKQAGVTAIVECSPVGVGRRADIVRAVPQATQLPVVVPTGIYREPGVPDWARAASEAELVVWRLGELQDESGFCAEEQIPTGMQTDE
jgi:phosphotriesterase-related protein